MAQSTPRGLPGSVDPLDQELCRYARLLRSAPHNLLSARGLDELEVRHFPEAVAFTSTLPSGPRLLDIGSGGGLPGIVIALLRPDLAVHLMDATGKKATFLREAADELGLALTVHHGRAEELGSGVLAGTFDIVTARAVASLDRLVPWAVPFLRPGGTLHAIKGDRWRAELQEATDSIARSGLEVVGTPDEPVGTPVEGGPQVVVLRRRSRSRYPSPERRVGHKTKLEPTVR